MTDQESQEEAVKAAYREMMKKHWPFKYEDERLELAHWKWKKDSD